MEPVYRKEFTLTDREVDCFGRLTLSALLFLAQEAAGSHSELLGAGYDTLAKQGLFWAVTRHRVQITRLPVRGETVVLETWPMPTSRVAFPRSLVAYDSRGQELFRSVSLWVLMDGATRAMVLPGKSGVTLRGHLTGSELAAPHSLALRGLGRETARQVTYSCLDRNGHMNNTRYMDWVEDLLDSRFHRERTPGEFVICYLSEAREGQRVRLQWDLTPEGCLQVDGRREETGERVFTAQGLYRDGE